MEGNEAAAPGSVTSATILTGSGEGAADAPPANDTGEKEPGQSAPPVSEEADAPPVEDEPQKPAEPLTAEAYQYQMPEGVEADKEFLVQVTDIALKSNVSPEAAGELVGAFLKQVGSIQEAALSAQWNNVLEQEKGWIKEFEKDSNWPETLAHSRKAIARYGDEDLIELLNGSRLGSHPALVRAFAKIGEDLGEPEILKGSSGNGGKGAAEVLYPNQN